MAALRSRTWSLARDRRFLGVVLAGAVFLIAWWCLGFWFYNQGRIVDTPTYQDYGLKMRLGLVPYRDFAVEYPPGALPAFLVPAYFGQPTVLASYGAAFSRLMALCGLGLLGFVLLSRPPRRAVVFVAFCPLLVGYLIETRFDLWPALFVAGAIAAFVHDRHRLGWLALGFAFAAKLYAVVLVPLAIVWTLRRRGGSELVKGLAIWALAVAAAFLPFALIAPHGLWESLWGQLSRPLQIESTTASILTTFWRPTVVISHGSASIAGYGWLEAVTTGVELVCLVVLWVAFARGPANEDRFVRHAAACVAAFIAFGKVLSPQFLIWLVPLVPLVHGRRGLVASALLGIALVEAQFWLTPARYARYLARLDYAPVVLSRNVLIVAILLVVALPAARHGPA